jgi:hypothetical protein
VSPLTRSCFLLSLLAIALPMLASQPQITISLYNAARIPEQFLAEAIEQASRIFLKAGLQTRWLECSISAIGIQRDADCKAPFGPSHMALRIVPGTWVNGDATFGVAFLSAEGYGVYGDVFYGSVEKLHKDSDVNISAILGHVMAHEIGHLLLGSHAHSPAGIMLPQWHENELRSLMMGTLLFTPQQARAAHEKLLSVNGQ